MKVFQSNANCPLGDSPCFIINRFEHIRGLDSEVQVEQIGTCPEGLYRRDLGLGSGHCTGTLTFPVGRQIDRLKTLHSRNFVSGQ